MAKKTLSQRIAADPALRAKYLANPGLRSKLDASQLTPQQRRQRATNARLNEPITDGSSVTNRQLSHDAANATTVRYGAQDQALNTRLQRAQGVSNDTAAWYDAYRKELQGHAANTKAINDAAVAQDAQLQQGVRGLDQTQAAGLTGDLAGTASQASMVRQAMLAGFGSQQAGVGAANNQYADTLANVVASGQKLRAQAQAAQGVRDVGDQITSLAGQKGAFNADYRSGRVADEFKNILSQQALGLDVTKATAAIKDDTMRRQETRQHNRATETADERRIRLAEDKDAAQRAARTGPYAPAKGSKGTVRKLLTPQQHSAAKDQIDQAQSWIKKLEANGVSSTTVRQTLLNGAKGKDKKGNPVVVPKIPKDLINAAYDLATNGSLSKANIAALHRRGLSIKQLGLVTATLKKGELHAGVGGQSTFKAGVK